MTIEAKKSTWDLETGLPSDIDAWITNPHFGLKDEYAQKVQAAGGEGLMFIVDLLDEKGELAGSQGYSIGTGWIVSEDGMEISHPKRKNVVNSCLYGQFQKRVVQDLKVDMEKYGLPTQAKSWDGLGFHWMQEEHPTVAGPPSTGIMPNEFLGERVAGAVKVAAAPLAGVEKTLADLVGSSANYKAFQIAALKIAEVTSSDELMAKVLDEGPEGFYVTHK